MGMNGARILLALAKWLYFEPHPNGVRFSINRLPSGESWFLVERASILVPAKDFDSDEVVVDGKRYVRVGGGPQEGKYVFIGDE
jgi:hypothetical protein